MLSTAQDFNQRTLTHACLFVFLKARRGALSVSCTEQGNSDEPLEWHERDVWLQHGQLSFRTNVAGGEIVGEVQLTSSSKSSKIKSKDEVHWCACRVFPVVGGGSGGGGGGGFVESAGGNSTTLAVEGAGGNVLLQVNVKHAVVFLFCLQLAYYSLFRQYRTNPCTPGCQH